MKAIGEAQLSGGETIAARVTVPCAWTTTTMTRGEVYEVMFLAHGEESELVKALRACANQVEIAMRQREAVAQATANGNGK